MDNVDDVVKEFLIESYENLDRLDRELVELEKNPNDKNILSSIFRTIHTIKGTSGFFGYSKLESVAHVGENLLSRLRDGKLSITPDIANGLLILVDAIRQMLACVEKEGNCGTRDFTELVELLKTLNEDPKPNARQSTMLPVISSEPKPAAPEAQSVSPAPLLVKKVPETDHIIAKVEAAKAPVRNPMKTTELMREFGQNGNNELGKNTSMISENNIRVDVGLLDKLMNLVGELVLARNQILQVGNAFEDNTFNAASQRLNLVTTELQESVMKTRMQPIGSVWAKFPRVVRDLAQMCNKQVRLDMEGKDTELDRTIIEAIKDPLTHIVRNSVDHGIESSADRVKAGKPAEGRLLVKAFHEGGQVIIEIEDDGGGINTERVRAKAIQNGIVTADAAARLTERELINLVFAPGFSTAEKVSNISGRGVGMDVVKTNIEKIGGSVDIQSQLGRGTTLKIKIPLTLAIIPALIVTSGGDRYAIPQVNLLELVRLEGEQARKAIETIQGSPVYRLRGNLLPLVYMNRELKLEPIANTQTVDDQTINIVILRADDHHFGLVVDTICDTEEIVVKPLSKQLKSISAFAGATIMGDGQVALILDVLGIAQRASVVGQVREKTKARASNENSTAGDALQTLLLFSAGKNSRLAIPLSEVARLEEFSRASIEQAGPQDVVQYRGEIMPLVHLSGMLEPGQTQTVSENTNLQVVVYCKNSRYVGLVVGQILDIVDANVTVKRSASRAGTLGSLVVQDRVTELLDLDTVLAQAEGKTAA